MLYLTTCLLVLQFQAPPDVPNYLHEQKVGRVAYHKVNFSHKRIKTPFLKGYDDGRFNGWPAKWSLPACPASTCFHPKEAGQPYLLHLYTVGFFMGAAGSAPRLPPSDPRYSTLPKPPDPSDARYHSSIAQVGPFYPLKCPFRLSCINSRPRTFLPLRRTGVFILRSCCCSPPAQNSSVVASTRYLPVLSSFLNSGHWAYLQSNSCFIIGTLFACHAFCWSGVKSRCLDNSFACAPFEAFRISASKLGRLAHLHFMH